MPGEFHGQRSLVGYSPWGCKELDTTEQLTFSFTAFILFFFLGHICQDRGHRRGDKTIWKLKQMSSVRQSKKKSSFHRDLINKQQTKNLCCCVCAVVKVKVKVKLLSHVQLFATQLLSSVQFFATSRAAAHQAPLSSTISQNLIKFTFIESVMLSNHLILCLPLLNFTFNLSQHQGLFQ